MPLARLLRALLLIGLTFFVLGWIVVTALNLYLSTSTTSAFVRSVLSGIAGIPVRFDAPQIDVLKGVSVSHVEAENPASPNEPILLTAPTVHATYAPLALFEHRILVRQLWLYHPVIALAESPQGRILLPMPPQLSSGPVSIASTLPVKIKSLDIEQGTLRILGPDKAPVLLIEGIGHGGRFRRNRDGAIDAAGQLKADAFTCGPFHAGNLEASYTADNHSIQVTKLLATAYHGQIAGTLQLHDTPEALLFDTNLQASAIDLNEWLKAVFNKPDALSGTLNLTLAGHTSSGLTGMSAQGSFDIHNGQLIHAPFLEDLSTTLNLKELSQPDFNQCHGEYTIENRLVHLTTFSLEATHFTLSGSGTVAFDGTVKLDCRLQLQPDLVKLLPPIAKLATNEEGILTIPFTLTGTIDAPNSDLLNFFSAFNLKPAPTPSTTPAPAAPAPHPASTDLSPTLP